MNIPTRSMIDCEELFDRRIVTERYGFEPQPVGSYYDDDRGMVLTASVEDRHFIQDLIQFAPDAVAFTGLSNPLPLPSLQHQKQLTGDGEWIHFSIRLAGEGYEQVAGHDGRLNQPKGYCTITRYPAGSLIERISDLNDPWKVACLWVKPTAFLRLLETSGDRVPIQFSWLVAEKAECIHHVTMPLVPQLQLVVSDILESPFRGGVRRAFLFSKYLEILANIYQSMISTNKASAKRLSEKEISRIHTVAAHITKNLHSIESLNSLAKSVGINRTKLAKGFREVYGVPVEAYWREWRLNQARELLQKGEMSVSEIADIAGYSELSAFTRAFTRQFGAAPSSFTVLNS